MRNPDLIWKPIGTWPREQTRVRESSPFRSKWSSSRGRGQEIGWTTTREELIRELTAINVREAVIQLALTDRDIRIDGQIRANAKLSHPGVIVTLTHPKHGPLSFACDKWTNWEANIRGITKGLEALRLVERYGITSTGEQYVGYKELSGGTAMPGSMAEEVMTPTDAARILAGAVSEAHSLARNTVLVLEDEDFRRYAYREAVKLAHPDKGVAASEGFLRIQKAKEVLDERA